MEAAASPLTAERQKELGAFYTPPEIAAVLARWAIRSQDDVVLDPSFGGLAFLTAAAKRLRECGRPQLEIGGSLLGIDLDPDALSEARGNPELALPAESLRLSDFFDVDPSEFRAADVLLGNPPYIRYQGFNPTAARAREIAAQAGVPMTKLASSWAPFVVHGASFIAPGGRMAQVLPAELLHAQYASGLLEFLQAEFGRVTIVLFEERVFPGALEEVVLLFADDRGARPGGQIQLLSCASIRDLDIGLVGAGTSHAVPDGQGKLLIQLLPESTQRLFSALSERADVSRLGGLADVDIGVVTGANSFFVLSEADASEIDPSLLRPAVSKATQVPGARLTADDHDHHLRASRSSLLLVADEESGDAALRTLRKHIEAGERAGFHQRYKCRIRSPWWALPAVGSRCPDLLLTYCSSECPRLAVNELEALHTNTLHGVTLTDDVDASALAAGFYNSLTMLSAEVVGRSYGGGVLKLEPAEAEDLIVPPLGSEVAALLPDVDAAVRARDYSGALDLVDSVVLGKGLGLTHAEIRALRAGVERLRSRRLSRGKAPRG